MSIPFRSAWIIGASSGIGRELAKIMSKVGVDITVSARRAKELETLKTECPTGRLTALPFDIVDTNAVKVAMESVERDIGLPDIVIIAAGIYEPVTADGLDPDLFGRIMAVNYLGVVNVLSAIMPGLLARGRGHITVISSVAGYRGLPLASAYGPSKAAIINLCESLQPELKARGICIQVVNPGFVDTPMTHKNHFAMPFMIQPEDAARRLFLGIQTNRFEITFPKRFTWLLKAMRILPYWLYFRLVGKLTGTSRRIAERQS